MSFADLTTLPGQIGSGTKNLARSWVFRPDLYFAVGIIGILTVLLLPVPTWLLDALLTVSITISVVILMTVLFINRHLDLSSFPTILLLTALMRLSLNVASTRLILSNGHEGTDAAGQVIEAFGNFVMAGEVIIGVIVFAILTIINFMVVTKGSGRIAEVSARFSLDAMPGKQMAIDADLSAGLINEDQARARRKELEDESTFFGAMDGASKFVRGDAIAGLMITFVNLIGGILIGVVQRDLSFSEALQTYTILTIGDGLVSQIPALIVSVSAGLLVAKSAKNGTTEAAVIGQLRLPQALGLSSAILLAMALVPGLPAIPFLVFSALLGFSAWYSAKQGGYSGAPDVAQKGNERVNLGGKGIVDANGNTISSADGSGEQATTPPEDSIAQNMQIDALRLELGYGLLPLINYNKGHRLTEQIKALRRQLVREMGFVMPSVRIQDNMQLPANSYVLRVKDIECGKGELRPDMLLVMNPAGEDINLPGEATHEPTFGLPAMWIAESNREEALFKNYTVVDPPTVITTHLTEIIKENMADMLSYSETQKLLDECGEEHQKLIADTIPTVVTLNMVQRVLQKLLSEQVSIRDLPTIIEAISEVGKNFNSVMLITEHVRGRLARQISHANTNEEGHIPLLTLSAKWEQAFLESLTGQGEERQLAMAPSRIQEFIAESRNEFDKLAMQGQIPVLLTSTAIRPYVRSIVERFRPGTIVMSQSEIHPKAKIKTLGGI